MGWRQLRPRKNLTSCPGLVDHYNPSYVKIAPASTAFYRGAKILETKNTIDGATDGGILESIPDIVLYGSADKNTPLRFPHIDKLIDENGTVAFEADTLIQQAQIGKLALYQKGVGVLRREPDLFEVCELTVRHPGLNMTGAGFTKGWFYRRQPDGLWSREKNPMECPCDSEIVHGQHISALHIAEEYLKSPKEFD